MKIKWYDLEKILNFKNKKYRFLIGSRKHGLLKIIKKETKQQLQKANGIAFCDYSLGFIEEFLPLEDKK